MAKLDHVKKKRGHPTTYDAATAFEACNRMAMGRSIRDVCMNDTDMAPISTFFAWLDAHPELKAHYQRCKVASAHAYRDMVEKLSRGVADNKQLDFYGKKTDQLDPQAVRIATDNFKWLAKVTAPHEFNEKAPEDENNKAAVELNIKLTDGTGRFTMNQKK